MKKILITLVGILFGCPFVFGQIYYPEDYDVRSEVEKAEQLHPEQLEETMFMDKYQDEEGYFEQKVRITIDELPDGIKDELASREFHHVKIKEAFRVESLSEPNEIAYEVHVEEGGQDRILMFFDVLGDEIIDDVEF
jgi:hypothetical protein